MAAKMASTSKRDTTVPKRAAAEHAIHLSGDFEYVKLKKIETET